MLFGYEDERFIAILFARLFAVSFVKLSDNMNVTLLRPSPDRRNVRHPIATIFRELWDVLHSVRRILMALWEDILVRLSVGEMKIHSAAIFQGAEWIFISASVRADSQKDYFMPKDFLMSSTASSFSHPKNWTILSVWQPGLPTFTALVYGLRPKWP